MAKVWRKTVMTSEIIDKLELWFSYWFTDREACLFANIWESTLYDYCQANPEFSERKEILKNSPTIKAKTNVVKKINSGDIPQSNRRLERKAKNEFSTKQEVDAKVEGDINLNINFSK